MAAQQPLLSVQHFRPLSRRPMGDFGHNADNQGSNDSSHEKHQHGNSLSLITVFIIRKLSIQQQVVNDLEATGEEERHTHQSNAADKDGRQHWRD